MTEVPSHNILLYNYVPCTQNININISLTFYQTTLHNLVFVFKCKLSSSITKNNTQGVLWDSVYDLKILQDFRLKLTDFSNKILKYQSPNVLQSTKFALKQTAPLTYPYKLIQL